MLRDATGHSNQTKEKKIGTCYYLNYYELFKELPCRYGQDSQLPDVGVRVMASGPVHEQTPYALYKVLCNGCTLAVTSRVTQA